MCTGFEWIPTIFGGGSAAGSAAIGLGAAELGATAAGAAMAGGGGAALGGAVGGAALGGLGTEAVLAGLGEGALNIGAGGFGAGTAAAGGGYLSGLGAEEVLAGLGEGSANIGAGAAGGAGYLGGLGTEELLAGLGEGAANIGTFGAAGAGSNLFSSAVGAFQKYGQPVMAAHSALTGMARAEEMRRMARLAQRQADPWGTSGGRGLADAQLQELLRDPSKVAASDPAFKLRVMGAQRANAQYGQDSGKMSIAGADASTEWYNARLAQLAGLSGAGVNPGQSSQLALGGLGSAAELESSALASLGYGAAGLGGTKGGLTPQQQQQLIELALRKGG